MDDDESCLPLRRQGSRRPSGGPSSDLTELWKDGEKLSDAWWRFAVDYAYQNWRSAIDKGTMDSRALLMQANMFANVCEGHLLAIGVREADTPYTGPEIIPPDLFETNLDFVNHVFADTTRLTLAGRSWVKVRLTERKYAAAEIKGNELKPAIKIKSKMGRRSIDEELRQIVATLRDEGQFDGVIGKERENRVGVRARETYPRLFPTATRPSREKVRQALKAQGCL